MSKTKKLIVLGVPTAIIGVSLYFSPTILSYLPNSSSSNSSNSSYTSLMLRNGMNDSAAITFGDTDYNIKYYFDEFENWSYLTITSSISSDFLLIGRSVTHNLVQKGDTFTDFGVEIKVSNIASDYVSNYIVILVKPVIQNYATSLHYTKVNITLGEPKSIDISSGLTNETHRYTFTYTQLNYGYNVVPQITISNNSQQETESVGESSIVNDLNVEVDIYDIGSTYMVFYVKPLY